MQTTEKKMYLEQILEREYLSERDERKIRKLINQCMKDILSEYPERTDIKFAANHIIESSQKRRYCRYGAWIMSGKQYVSDGHRAMEIINPIPLLEGHAPSESYPEFFANARTFDETIPCPSIHEIKRMLVECIEKEPDRILTKAVYWIHPEFCVNAMYLLDAVIATGANSCKIKKDNGQYYSGMFFESEACSTLIMPMKFSRKKPVGSCQAIYK